MKWRGANKLYKYVNGEVNKNIIQNNKTINDFFTNTKIIKPIKFVCNYASTYLISQCFYF